MLAASSLRPGSPSISKSAFEFERHLLSTEELRELIVNEVRYYHGGGPGSNADGSGFDEAAQDMRNALPTPDESKRK